ncbi:MAG: FHA domain-containing protein [Deltaproteobacteria bacterium]|nr:FHA domain-containing protein [Deltaproteobacteria bacterium]
MRLQLPAIEREDLGTDPAVAVARIAEVLSAGAGVPGYLQVDSSRHNRLLMIHQGKIFGAGQAESGRFAPLSLAAFFAGLEPGQAFTFCQTDLPLFLCIAVLFRKAPAAQIPSGLVDSASLLDSVRQMGKDAVLVVRRQETRSLVFCHEGEPVALYPGPEAGFPAEGSVADRIIEYVYAGTARPDVTLDLYDEIRIQPSADGGRPLDEYVAAGAEAGDDGREPSLVVLLGGRVVFRYPVFLDTFRIGRGGENDLPLDNLSVSRQHAVVRRKGDNLIFEDQGSENGLRVGDNRVSHVELRPGDDLEIGKYTLLYRIFEEGEAELPAVVPAKKGGGGGEETVALGSETRAELEWDGKRHKMSGFIFSIGSGSLADLRIPGFFVAPVHARVMREADGGFRLDHVKGRRAVRVNGEKITRHSLKDGDVIAIGKVELTFVLP